MSLDSYNNRKINIDSDSKVFRAGIVRIIVRIAGENSSILSFCQLIGKGRVEEFFMLKIAPKFLKRC